MAETLNDMYLDWVTLYENGFSTVEIGERYKKDPSNVGAKLRKLGVTMRSNKENSRRYEFNNTRYFQNINTAEKAYFLGFMYADGYVTSSDGSGARSFGVSLSMVDIHILEQFKKELKSTHPVNVYKSYSGYSEGNEYCRLLIRNDDTVQDLVNNGVVEKKTNIITRPNSVPSDLIRHFIRGYFDGDGSIKITKPANEKMATSFCVSFLGTDDILHFISDYFLEKDLIKRVNKFQKRREGQIVSCVDYGGNIQSKKILDHLYEESTVCLERKYKRYLMLKEQHSRIYA